MEAFKIAQKKVKATLVLLGDFAVDDHEGPQIYKSLLDSSCDRIIIKHLQNSTLVNPSKPGPPLLYKKSIREGFGLAVAEAMSKGTPVIGGNVGGIRFQIQDGVNGFLVSSVEETARRIVEIIKAKGLREYRYQ